MTEHQHHRHLPWVEVMDHTLHLQWGTGGTVFGVGDAGPCIGKKGGEVWSGVRGEGENVANK